MKTRVCLLALPYLIFACTRSEGAATTEVASKSVPAKEEFTKKGDESGQEAGEEPSSSSIGKTSRYATSANGETMLLLRQPAQAGADQGIWLYRKSKPLKRLSEKRGGELWVSPDGSMVAWSGDTDVRVLDINTEEEILHVDADGVGECAESCWLGSLRVSLDRQRVFAVDSDSGIGYVWTAGEARPYFAEHLLAMSPDGKICTSFSRLEERVRFTLRTCTKPSTLVFLDSSGLSAEETWGFSGHDAHVYLAGGTINGRELHVNDMRSGRLLWKAPANAWHAEEDGTVWAATLEGIQSYNSFGKLTKSLSQSSSRDFENFDPDLYGALLVNDDEVLLIPRNCPWPQQRWNRHTGKRVPAVLAPAGIDCSQD